MVPALPRHAWTVFALGCALVLTGVVGTRVSEIKSWVVFWDNVHWTSAYATGAALAWLGWRTAAPVDRAARGWFFAALTMYTIGQAMWDAQVYSGWNPFPGPSDAGFLLLGVLIGAGFISLLRGRISSADRWAVGLDAAMIAVVSLTFTLALYLPRRGTNDLFTTVVLVAYPVALLSALGIGLVTLLALRLRPTVGNLLLLAMVLADGVIWMQWNSLTLDNALGDGVWFNFTFSIVAPLLGLGACAWTSQASTDPAWDRKCFTVLRVLPLVLVLMAALAITFGRRLAPEAQDAADLGTVTVILLAIVRQSLLLRERDRLLLAERDLRASEERFRQFAGNVDDVFWLRDAASGKMTYVSPALVTIWGITADELYANPLRFVEAIHLEDRGRVLAAAQTTTPPWEDRYRVVRADGDVRWIRDRGFRVPDPSGGPGAIAGIAEDITDQVRAEEVLRESETRLREIVTACSDAIFLVGVESDGGFTIIDINPAGAEGLGVPLERILGRRTDQIFPREAAEGFNGHYRDCLASDAAISYEELVPSPLGPGWYSTALVPIRDSRGRIQRIAGIARNITAQRNANESMFKLNAELERRVAERTNELAVSNNELSAFAYSVSHDLRAPLRSIDGFSEALLEDHAASLDAEGRRCLDKIRSATQRMGHLIDDLLTLSRVTRVPVQRQRIDLGVLARTVFDELRARNPERTVTIAIASDMMAEVDPGLARIALENLMGNSWKFTRNRADAHISLTAERHDHETVFRLSDNGAGFDMTYSGKLFTAFQRLHGEHEFEGTGIGLATVHRVISRHGGRIWAEGQVDNGASFFFSLPG